MKKNEKERIRFEYFGTIPTLSIVRPSQKVGPKPDGPSEYVKWTKSRIINASPIKAKAAVHKNK